MFSEVFSFSSYIISQTLYAKGKGIIKKEKVKPAALAGLFTVCQAERLSSLGKRVQKYSDLIYNPNIYDFFSLGFIK